MNVAVMLRSASNVTQQSVLVFVQAPDQPVKREVVEGVAARFKAVPCGNACVHVPTTHVKPDPGEVLLTEPVPSPAMVTDRIRDCNAAA